MSGRVCRPASPVPAIATSTLIQSAVAVLRIHAHETAPDRARARDSSRAETALIVALATLVTTDAKCPMG